jgi:sugar lactone lactonase YvrE
MKKYLLSILITIIFDASAQNITTVAGVGSTGYNGDGIPATTAAIARIGGICTNSEGELFISDLSSRLRKVNGAGVISTIAGLGTEGYAGDNIDASLAPIAAPNGIVFDDLGNLIFCDFNNSRIRKITPSGSITTIAGTGGQGYTGDGGQAILAQIGFPSFLARDAAGNLYFAVANHHRVRKIDTFGIITTIAGTGTSGYNGEGGAAYVNFSFPQGIAIDNVGNIYITEANANRIRKINTLGMTTTIAGTGTAGYNGDHIQATTAKINLPVGLRIDAQGNLYFADASNNRIRKIDTNGVITTIVGTGSAIYNGDGIPAITATLNRPVDIAFDAAGSMYIADNDNFRIRKVGNVLPTDHFEIALNSITLFPNPTIDGCTTLNFPESATEIQVVDILGKVILKEKTMGRHRLEITHLDSGFYVVQVSFSGQTVTKKLIVGR